MVNPFFKIYFLHTRIWGSIAKSCYSCLSFKQTRVTLGMFDTWIDKWCWRLFFSPYPTWKTPFAGTENSQPATDMVMDIWNSMLTGRHGSQSGRAGLCMSSSHNVCECMDGVRRGRRIRERKFWHRGIPVGSQVMTLSSAGTFCWTYIWPPHPKLSYRPPSQPARHKQKHVWPSHRNPQLYLCCRRENEEIREIWVVNVLRAGQTDSSQWTRQLVFNP